MSTHDYSASERDAQLPRGELPPHLEAVPPPDEPPEDEETSSSSWEPIDLTPYLAADYCPPKPEVLRRSDGLALFYPGKVHSLNGESESGKTWITLEAMRQEVQAGHKVAYLDFEDSPDTLIDRLLCLGLSREEIAARVLYFQPSGWDVLAPFVHVNHFHADVTLVIVDGVTEAMSGMSLILNDPGDVATWIKRLRRWGSNGAAVVQIDHVVKSAEARGRYAIGSVHKMNAVDGAVYGIDGIKPFGRGKTGASKIVVMKDRPGAVRGALDGKTVAEVEFASEPETGLVTVGLASASREGKPFQPTALMVKINDFLKSADEPMSRNAILGGVRGKAEYKRLALDALIDGGWVEREQHGQKHLHRLARPFAPDENPPTESPSPTKSQPGPGLGAVTESPSPSLIGDSDPDSVSEDEDPTNRVPAELPGFGREGG